METPATAVAPPGTMIAPKRAVMIDDLARAIAVRADSDSEAMARPSHPAGAKRGHGRRSNSLPVDRPVPENAPVTCSTCRMTYLPSAIPDSASSRGWVCDGCQRILDRRAGRGCA